MLIRIKQVMVKITYHLMHHLLKLCRVIHSDNLRIAPSSNNSNIVEAFLNNHSKSETSHCNPKTKDRCTTNNLIILIYSQITIQCPQTTKDKPTTYSKKEHKTKSISIQEK